MAKSSATEIFSSPEAQQMGVATLVGGPMGTLAAAGGAAGKAAAREGEQKFAEAFETAKGLKTTAETSGTQATRGATSQTAKTTFESASPLERELTQQSIDAFAAQRGLVNDQEAAIMGRSGLEGQARGSLGQVLGGGAFDLTPSEEARINRLRETDIAAGSDAINRLLTERLGGLEADAARRGLRGQAFTQLQTGALGEAAQSLERRTLEANRLAAQQALAMPGQRVGIQAQAAGQFADFSDVLRQQALQNRQSLQDPVALQQLRDERLRGGSTTTAGTTDQTATTGGLQTNTGQGAADILAASAAAPGQKAGQLSGAMGALDIGVRGLGAVAGAG